MLGFPADTNVYHGVKLAMLHTRRTQGGYASQLSQ